MRVGGAAQRLGRARPASPCSSCCASAAWCDRALAGTGRVVSPRLRLRTAACAHGGHAVLYMGASFDGLRSREVQSSDRSIVIIVVIVPLDRDRALET